MIVPHFVILVEVYWKAYVDQYDIVLMAFHMEHSDNGRMFESDLVYLVHNVPI